MVNIELLKKLHRDGLTNRKIAIQLKCHHTTVGNKLKELKLKPNGTGRLDFSINGEVAICSKCGVEKSLDEFLYNRKGKKYEYRFTYCMECRRKQTKSRSNSSIEQRLKEICTITRTRARKKELEFDLDADFLLKIYKFSDGCCFYTGKVMEWKVGSGYNPNSLSIDRIVHNKGYTKDNIVLCLGRVNTIKNNLTLEELKEYIPSWYNKLKTFNKL